MSAFTCNTMVFNCWWNTKIYFFLTIESNILRFLFTYISFLKKISFRSLPLASRRLKTCKCQYFEGQFSEDNWDMNWTERNIERSGKFLLLTRTPKPQCREFHVSCRSCIFSSLDQEEMTICTSIRIEMIVAEKVCCVVLISFISQY